MSKSGTLVLQGHNYVVYDKHVRTVLQKAPHLVPGDEIEYADNNILTIRKRRQHSTLAIVRGTSEGKSFLFCPLLGPLYNPHLNVVYPIGTRLLVLIPAYPNCQPVVIEEFRPFRDVEGDLDALQQTYLSMATTTPLTSAVSEIPYKSMRYTKADADDRGLDAFVIDPCVAFTPVLGEHRILIHVIDIHQLLDQTASTMGNHLVEIHAANKGVSCSLGAHTTHILPKRLAEKDYCLRAKRTRPVITVDVQFRPGTTDVAHYDIYRNQIYPQQVLGYIALSTLLKNPKGPSDPFRYLTTLIGGSTFAPVLHLTVDGAHLTEYRTEYPSLTRNFVESIKHIADTVVRKHLSVPDVARFTNPIGRYSDIVLHHMLAGAVYETEYLHTLLDHLHHQTMCVEGLQTVYKNWKVGRWIEGHSFQAIVKGVSRAGIQIYVEELMLHGFIHVSALHLDGRNPRWQYERGVLVGTHGIEVGVGNFLQVTVTKSDALLGLLEFKGNLLENDIQYSVNSTNYS